MTQFKIKEWDGTNIVGGPSSRIFVSYKIDGVRLHVKNGVYLSRAGKTLYNLPEGLADGIYEIYRKNFKETISVVRSSKTEQIPIRPDEVYMLEPKLDPRLLVVSCSDVIESSEINILAQKAFESGYEGIVIRIGLKRWKVKERFSEDTRILGIYPGKGKYTGMLGGFITALGKVGTGLTDQDRTMYNTKEVIGRLIEVKYYVKFPTGKVRHPVFAKFREDLE